MMASLWKRFEELEKQRTALLQTLEKFDQGQLTFRPHPEQWSILQVLHHLILVEYYTNRYMEKKLQGDVTALRVNFQSHIRLLLLRLVLGMPLKTKIPSPAVRPDPVINFEEVKDQWEEQRKRLKSILGRIPPQAEKFPIYKHPLAGYFTPAQTLTFIRAHFKHHMKQIERIKNSTQFP